MINAFFIVLLFTQNPAETYNRANQMYIDGEMASAIELYETALGSIKHPDLYYNLGNAYFKQGKMGKAILNYRRAFFLAPRDHDINFNLTYTRSYRIDKIHVSESPLSVILRRMFQTLSMFEAQIITTILFLTTMVLLSVFVITQRPRYGYLCLCAFIFCLFFGSAWLTWSHILHAHHAVVIAPEVSALSGPGSDYKEILVLHDGSEVRIHEQRGDYALIQVPGGLGGWVPITALEQVF